MQYTLTLPAGTITLTRDGIFKGSNTTASWSPCNPLDSSAGGWVDGDTLVVTCSLNINPQGLSKLPPSTEYVGLCAGACNATDTTTVNRLIADAKGIITPNPGKLIGNGISTSSSRSTTSIFYNCTQLTESFILKPSSRGTLNNYVYQYSMTYNGQNTVAPANQVEIVFGYGDPMNSEVDS